MDASHEMNQGRRWVQWLFPVLFMLFLTGTGPCYDDDCSNPGEGWCEGQTAVSCEGAGRNMAYWLANSDCTLQNMTCVEGLGEGYNGPETPLSWCLDIQPCSKPGSFECGISPLDGLPMLMRCTNVAATDWFAANGIKKLVAPEGIQSVLEPLSGEGFGSMVTASLLCFECASTCGCESGTVCRDGYCVPDDIAEASDEDIVCCGKERGASCIKGTSCENLDGTQGLCQTGARCDPCEEGVDCESELLECVSTGGGLPTVCLEEGEAEQAFYDCRADLGEAWRVDACGRWVEEANDVATSYSCKEGTDQSWSLNACDEWIALAKDCGEGYRCEANECILRVPEIEVSPTLLNFGETALSASKVLSVNIGNLGDGDLVVSEMLFQPASVTSLMLSQSTLKVAADQIVTVDVTFSPKEAGAIQAKLLIRSNDQDEPEVAVLINGTGK